MFDADTRRRSGSVVALDWDTRTLRAVSARYRRGEVFIDDDDNFLLVKIPHDVDVNDPKQMGGFIRRSLDEKDVRARHAVVGIPREHVILNTLKLPAIPVDELPGVVDIQIAKELPFPISDAVVDFAVAPQDAGGIGIEVLVAAIRTEVVEQYQAVCEAAGLRVDRIGLRPYASKVALCRKLQPALPERVLFVDVRPTLTEIDVIRNGHLAFSRAASVPIPERISDSMILSLVRGDDAHSDQVDFADTPLRLDGILNALVLEITRSIEAYRAKDPGARIDHVVIGGDLGIEESLSHAIQERLKLTTQVFDPASIFGWEPVEREEAGAFAAAVGLVLSHQEERSEHFDFLHPKKMVSRTKQRLRKAPIAATVAVMFVLAAGVAVAGLTKPKRHALTGILEQISELAAQEKDHERFLDLVDEIEAFDGAQIVWVDALYDLFSLLPDSKSLIVTDVALDQNAQQITLKTRTAQRDTGTEIVQKLESFRREEGGKPVFRVSMGAQVEGDDDKYRYSQDFRITVLASGQAGRSD